MPPPPPPPSADEEDPLEIPGGDELFGPGPTAILPDVAELLKERDEYLAALQQLKADFENYKKRVLRQQEEQSARAARDLVGKLLPVLDTLDLAEAHLGGSDEPTADAKALSQARTQLLDVLVREGLERVDQAEVVFDPEAHDAVAYSAPAEQPADAMSANGAGRQGDDTQAGDDAPASNGSSGQSMVEEVLRSGYRWRGQTLRPAMVRVRG